MNEELWSPWKGFSPQVWNAPWVQKDKYKFSKLWNIFSSVAGSERAVRVYSTPFPSAQALMLKDSCFLIFLFCIYSFAHRPGITCYLLFSWNQPCPIHTLSALRCSFFMPQVIMATFQCHHLVRYRPFLLLCMATNVTKALRDRGSKWTILLQRDREIWNKNPWILQVWSLMGKHYAHILNKTAQPNTDRKAIDNLYTQESWTEDSLI